jgi:glucuronate isomerase
MQFIMRFIMAVITVVTVSMGGMGRPESNPGRGGRFGNPANSLRPPEFGYYPRTAVKPFLDEDFLLPNQAAVRLYHEFAEGEPIIDYHCHLPPDQIASNHRFATLTEIWLNGDHYKWRALRANGVPERLITGAASDWEKFEAWARTVPATLRNPLYHWTHLELRFPFGVKGKLLCEKTAREIYDRCGELLQQDEFTTQGLLRQYRVLVVCSTDDPTDSLEHHARHAERIKGGQGGQGGKVGKGTTKGSDVQETRLYPTWRPDRALQVHDLSAWNDWVGKLEAASGLAVGSYSSLLEALRKRHDVFHARGCRASDHGLEMMYASPYTEREVALIFEKARAGKGLSGEEIEKFRSAVLHDTALFDHARGWTQQFHLGAMRNNSTRMMRALGPDTGFDSIGDLPQASAIARFLDRLDTSDQLPRTILYNLNPRDNEVFATVLGNFQDGSVPGKMQFGSAWWFLDQLDGMEKQINSLSNMGLLSRFVGMLTDSRSFLSYSRHEYFRRLLCAMLGSDIERGLLPNDLPLVGELVKDVCFRNARAYFGFELDE